MGRTLGVYLRSATRATRELDPSRLQGWSDFLATTTYWACWAVQSGGMRGIEAGQGW